MSEHYGFGADYVVIVECSLEVEPGEFTRNAPVRMLYKDAIM
jgi:hypothetical protein